MINNDSIKITVFTPTFNRAFIIDNLYQSLVKQSYKNFEWIVIDQGSDDTEKMIEQYKGDGIISDLIYFRNTDRVGINRAYNDALKISKGELFFKVDDDDFLSNDALEEIIKYYSGIKGSGKKMAGVAGLRGYHNGNPIGTKWKVNADYIDALNFDRKKFGLSGDKAEAYITDVLREFAPMPEVEGEEYTDEGILYNRIAAAGYKIRWFNKIIYYTEYLPNGISTNWRKTVKNNPISYRNNTLEYMNYSQFSLPHKIKTFATFSSVYRELGYNREKIFEGFPQPVWLLELGWIAGFISDFVKGRNRRPIK